MFVQVRLLKGFQELLWYTVPEHLTNSVVRGSILKVPFRTQSMPALVEHITQTDPKVAFKVKDIIAIESLPADTHYYQLLQQLAYYYQVPVIYFVKRLRQFLISQGIDKQDATLNTLDTFQSSSLMLTSEQQCIASAVCDNVMESTYAPIVIHGVTASGKTEIYKKGIEKAIQQKKSVIFLLPEVALAVQFAHILRAMLDASISIFGFHSATSIKEKRALWQALCKAQPILIVGVHLPILLPIANLGLIVVDEEHEIGFQEKKHPKINSKEVALMRAKLIGIPIVLGSATPSIATLDNVHKKGWQFFQLKKRFSGSFPQIQLINLRDGKQRKKFWISLKLQHAIQERLAKQEQIIIFLNRRGFSFFVQCASCSFVFCCAACSVSFTLHERDRLICHYCGIMHVLPNSCPSCKKDARQFLKKGVGTQQVVGILQELFPTASIARADIDTTINRKKWKRIIEEFQNGHIDMLVGTQTITKGYHFPRVTLVGILWADMNLHFPMYNATETALQQLIQVAGRAGRSSNNGLVIVQTMADYQVFDYLNEVSYLAFYKTELAARQAVGYPPAIRLVEIELKSKDEALCNHEAQHIFDNLAYHIAQKSLPIKILGPALPPVHKIKHMHARKIYLKGANVYQLIKLYQLIDHHKYKSQIYFVPNPLA